MGKERRSLRNAAILAAASMSLISCADQNTPDISPNAFASNNNQTIDIATLTPTNSPTIEITPWPEPKVEPNPTIPQIESYLKRTEGIWTKHEMGELAISMLREEKYKDISHAGELLADSLNGIPNPSKENKLFRDDPIRIETIFEKPNGNYTALISSIFIATDRINFDFIETDTGNQLNTDFESKLHLVGIELNLAETADLSDFGLKFLIASQFKRTESVALISEFLNGTNYTRNDQAQEEKNAVDVFEIKNSDITLGINGEKRINALVASNYFSQYLMIPTLIEAAQNGEFSVRDMELLKFYTSSAEYLIRKDAIVKNGDKYEFSNNKNLIIAAMTALAIEQAEITKSNITQNQKSGVQTY